MNKAQVLLKSIVGTNRIGTVSTWDQDEITKAFTILLKDVEPYCHHFNNPFKVDWLFIGAKKRKVRCLFLQTTDGKWYPLTKNKLVGKKESKRTKTIRLMREEIEDQIYDFKTKFKENQVRLIESGKVDQARKNFRCPYSGKIMSRVHVDHVVPFIVLADVWLETHTLYNKFEEVRTKDLKSWSAFHKRFAKLALVGASSNVERGSEGYRSTH